MPDQYVYGHDGMVVQCPWHAYEFHVDTGESVGGVLPGRVHQLRWYTPAVPGPLTVIAEPCPI